MQLCSFNTHHHITVCPNACNVLERQCVLMLRQTCTGYNVLLYYTCYGVVHECNEHYVLLCCCPVFDSCALMSDATVHFGIFLQEKPPRLDERDWGQVGKLVLLYTCANDVNL